MQGEKIIPKPRSGAPANVLSMKLSVQLPRLLQNELIAALKVGAQPGLERHSPENSRVESNRSRQGIVSMQDQHRNSQGEQAKP